jgi:hypothetical protein
VTRVISPLSSGCYTRELTMSVFSSIFSAKEADVQSLVANVRCPSIWRCGEVRAGSYQHSATEASKAGQFGVNELEREYVERELSAQNLTIGYSWISSEKRNGCPTHPVVGCVGT